MTEDVAETSEANVVTKGGSAKDITRVNQYKIDKKLGAGAFGAVYSATDQNSEVVAVKVMDKAELRKKSRGISKGPPGKGPPTRPGLSKSSGPKPSATGSSLVSDQLLREIATMKRVTHPNCVRLFEVIDDPLGDRMFLVMEYLNGGEVMDKKNLPDGDHQLLSEEFAVEVFRDLLNGLEYLHGNGILHRDIKPENMVYLERPDFKVPYSTRPNARTLDLVGATVGATVNKSMGAIVHAGASLAGSVQSIAGSVLTEEDSAAAKLQARFRGRQTRKNLITASAAKPADGDGSATNQDAPASAAPSSAPATNGGSATAPSHRESADGLGELSGRTPRGSKTPRGTQQPSSRADEPTRWLPPVKLLDFGISQVCVDAHDLDFDPTHVKKGFDDTILKATGTPAFFAPEMCHVPAVPFHGRPADVWAAGVTLCMLVSGRLPFESDNMPDVWRKVREEPPELPAHASEPLRALLKAMLAKKPEDRPTVAALRQHPWVTKNGTLPMEDQPYLPLEITDDDIQKAVKRFSNTFTILKAGKKWKAAAAASSARRESDEAGDARTLERVAEVEVQLPVTSVDVSLTPALSSGSSSKRSTFKGFAAAKRFSSMISASSSPKSKYAPASPLGKADKVNEQL